MPDVETKYAEDYKQIFANRTLGGMRNGYFEFELITETSNFEPALKQPQLDFGKTKITRILHAKLIVTPQELKSITTFFQKNIETFENVFGKIQEPKDTQAKRANQASDQSFIG